MVTETRGQRVRRALQQQTEPHPTRPSHAAEDQNVRVQPGALEAVEYPTEVYDTPDPTPAGPDPVPVWVIQPIPQKGTPIRFSAGSAEISVGSSGQLGGSNQNRKLLKVRNLSATETVYLVAADLDLDINGYPLTPGSEIDMAHHMEVYVRVPGDAGNPVTVGWYEEYYVPGA